MARRATRSRIGVRRRRRSRPTAFRLHAAEWIDPFPWIEGTKPEKMIFAELVRRGIYFRYQDNFPKEDAKFQVSADDPNFQPDILIPEWKVIIDPFGDFHHSQEKAREADARKLIFYTKSGYEFLHPWSSEVERYGPSWVLLQSKRLWGPPMFPLGKEDLAYKFNPGYKLGPWVGRGLAGIRAANKKRTRPKPVTIRPSQGR